MGINHSNSINRIVKSNITIRNDFACLKVHDNQIGECVGCNDNLFFLKKNNKKKV